MKVSHIITYSQKAVEEQLSLFDNKTALFLCLPKSPQVEL